MSLRVLWDAQSLGYKCRLYTDKNQYQIHNSVAEHLPDAFVVTTTIFEIQNRIMKGRVCTRVKHYLFAKKLNQEKQMQYS